MFVFHFELLQFFKELFTLQFKWILAYMSNPNPNREWHCKPNLCFVSFQLNPLDAKMSLQKINSEHRINLYIGQRFECNVYLYWREHLVIWPALRLICQMLNTNGLRKVLESKYLLHHHCFGINLFGGKPVETCIDNILAVFAV